jgi:hypothetical protein
VSGPKVLAKIQESTSISDIDELMRMCVCVCVLYVCTYWIREFAKIQACIGISGIDELASMHIFEYMNEACA